MIRKIKGELIEKNLDFCVIMAGGLGYKVNISQVVYSELPEEGKQVSLYTYLMVKEDALELYGFTRKDQLAVFELVLNVSGIGPKISLDLLATLSPKSFYLAVLNDEENKLTKIPGIGKKSAKRIILELKERVKEMELFESSEEVAPLEAFLEKGESVSEKGIFNEAKAALNSLGYSEGEAQEAIDKIKNKVTSDMELEEVLKLALKSLKKG